MAIGLLMAHGRWLMREMTHMEQARQLAVNALAIAKANASACAGIDKESEGRREGEKWEKPVQRYHAATIHDIAQDNPLIARLLRETARKYMP